MRRLFQWCFFVSCSLTQGHDSDDNFYQETQTKTTTLKNNFVVVTIFTHRSLIKFFSENITTKLFINLISALLTQDILRLEKYDFINNTSWEVGA